MSSWPIRITVEPVTVEIFEVVNGTYVHYLIYPPEQPIQISSNLEDAKARASKIAKDLAGIVNARKNAKIDQFRLSTPLKAHDWKFEKLLDGEHQLAWKWEAERQIRGFGKAWLKHTLEFRRKAVASLNRPIHAPVSVISGPVDKLPKDMPGTMLLTLDIDCGFTAKEVAAFVEEYLSSHPVFKATPKKEKVGRLNQYKAWLDQLGTVRRYHAGKVDSVDIHVKRRDTMKRLEQVKKRQLSERK